MRSHRTAARGIVFLLFATATAVGVAVHASAAPVAKVPPLIFPIVGPATYTDDFGEARGSGAHEGNDILAPKRAVVVAVEAGRVRFHTTSWRAGCMLYLDGVSGTTYLYVHLNNDLTSGNDNRGQCKPGVAYASALKSGARVSAGQAIAYNGDSGDANGGRPHLHFELRPGGGAAISPYRYLRAAKKLFVPVHESRAFTAALRGKVVSSDAATLTMDVERAQSWPGGIDVGEVRRRVSLALPPETAIFDPIGTLIRAAKLSALLKPGRSAIAWTAKTNATLEAALGAPLVLTASRIVLAKDDAPETARVTEPAPSSGGGASGR